MPRHRTVSCPSTRRRWAQPFFVWAQQDRVARGYLFGSDPHECFVDNFLTWAEPVHFHPKPKPVRKPAAKPAAKKKRPRRKR